MHGQNHIKFVPAESFYVPVAFTISIFAYKILSQCGGTVYCTKPFIKNFKSISFLGMVTAAFHRIPRHQ